MLNMKKTNSNISSSVSVTINNSISVSSEDSGTSENPKEAKNEGEPENPAGSSAPDTSNATPPETNEPPDDEESDSHKSFPYDDACASLLAYSICMESWRIALQKKWQRVKMGISIGIAGLLFFIAVLTAFQSCTADTSTIANTANASVASNAVDTTNAVDTSNVAVISNAADTGKIVVTSNAADTANKLSCADYFIRFICIGIIISAIIIGYYIFKFRRLDKWLEYNIEMLNHLSEDRTNLIVCDSESRDRMTSLINQYRCDKWVEEKEKQKQNQKKS